MNPVTNSRRISSKRALASGVRPPANSSHDALRPPPQVDTLLRGEAQQAGDDSERERHGGAGNEVRRGAREQLVDELDRQRVDCAARAPRWRSAETAWRRAGAGACARAGRTSASSAAAPSRIRPLRSTRRQRGFSRTRRRRRSGSRRTSCATPRGEPAIRPEGRGTRGTDCAGRQRRTDCISREIDGRPRSTEDIAQRAPRNDEHFAHERSSLVLVLMEPM